MKYNNKDFYLSAFLITSGCSLVGTVKENSVTTLFEFNDTAQLQNLIKQYYSMTATVEPMAYGAAIRSLKSVIHATNSNSNNYESKLQ